MRSCFWRETMSKYFGTDGFRGEANVDLTAEHAFKIGRFIGWYYGREHKARHCHRQGHPPLELYVRVRPLRRTHQLRRGRISAARHHDAQRELHSARSDDFDCGVMISASHNPYHDNGHQADKRPGAKRWRRASSTRSRPTSTERSPSCPHATGADIGRTVDYSAGSQPLHRLSHKPLHPLVQGR